MDGSLRSAVEVKIGGSLSTTTLHCVMASQLRESGHGVNQCPADGTPLLLSSSHKRL